MIARRGHRAHKGHRADSLNETRALFNLMVSRETVTEADMRLIEAIAKAVTKVEMRALAAGLETKSAVLTRCFVDAWRAAHEKALGETPEDFDHGR